MRHLATLLIALFGLSIAGCQSAPGLPNSAHTDADLTVNNQGKNSMRWTPDTVTYEGFGQPTQAQTTDAGVDITTEGPLGTAGMTNDGRVYVTTMNDLNIQGGKAIVRTPIVDAEGNLMVDAAGAPLFAERELSADVFAIAPSETRRAQNEALDRWQQIWADMSITQRAAVEANVRQIEAIAGTVSDVASGVISQLVIPH